MPTLLLHPLSDSFASLWATLAEEAGLKLETVTESAAFRRRGTVIGLVAAGGEERQIPEYLRELGRVEIECAFVGSDPSRRLATDAVRAGAADYFALPDDADALRIWLREHAARLRAETAGSTFAEAQTRRYTFDGILGDSPPLQRMLERAARVIPHGDVTVLITGETGTGKELLARAIHYNGPRRAAPFVDVNCAAIPENLLESELFGHEKGAFTGATSAKPGLFEEAEGGTLFLDEIGHLPLPLQGKLLRALQERTIRRIGGARNIPVDIRILAATHVNIAADVQKGLFREDLYYRLNVVPLELPPLRVRREDILLLARHFLKHFCAEYGLRRRLSPAAEEALQARPWPGNIRELRNCVERMVLLGTHDLIDVADIPAGIDGPAAATTAGTGRIPYPAPLRTIVRAAVQATLDDCGGNKSATARQLRISRTRLLRVLDGSEQDGEDDASDA